ncbi:hypothetical protein JOD54_001958 [Actinokineospora baliensis]|uniref:hypothetical protein n=1 Tax=Actinokineospora baliensis TaxID=547056 RepID=UPI001958895F|nr:hypothetical protein [Actinokineospora baliensis]MBM7771754.1 hypothetical protein [Actinokineospora baliensis]
MARDHARLYLDIWDDEDFLALSTPAKLMYLFLFSQRRLTYAGMLDVAVRRWAKSHPDLGLDGVRAALAELDAARFVVVDQDTEELLVRSFVRRDELWRQPNTLRAALRTAFEIVSPILRASLARELRRLPVEITGPAPVVAARELEAGARALPASVMAAMAQRPRRTDKTSEPPAPTPVEAEPARQSPVDTSGNPSPNPSEIPPARAEGEGSRERGTGVDPLALVDQEGGDPTRDARDTRARETPDDDQHAGSRRQRRRAEAERLVTVHTPEQPRRVRERLRAEVIELLREDVEPAVIAAGLRAWSGKRLPVSWLPELVAEHQRAALLAAAPAQRAQAVTAAESIERMRTDAIADDDRSPVGLAVRELPDHADPATLHALVADALAATFPADTEPGRVRA